MLKMMTTKEVAKFLNLNEKMVYSLISEKRLPATKVTGKWMFPRHLVEQWVESNTLNYPKYPADSQLGDTTIILAGSNDPLLEKTIHLFNRCQSNYVAVFGNLGSMGGVQALRQNRCHIATSHLLQEGQEDYNFEYAHKELNAMPAIVNFCRREQGIIMQKGNPKKISAITDLKQKSIKIINRSMGTGTRLLLDQLLANQGITGSDIPGYHDEVESHLSLGVEILSKRAEAGIGIRVIAQLFDLEFIPLTWERYDFMVLKDCFFNEGIQKLLSLLHEPVFQQLAEKLTGYDLSLSGNMVFPNEG